MNNNPLWFIHRLRCSIYPMILCDSVWLNRPGENPESSTSTKNLNTVMCANKKRSRESHRFGLAPLKIVHFNWKFKFGTKEPEDSFQLTDQCKCHPGHHKVILLLPWKKAEICTLSSKQFKRKSPLLITLVGSWWDKPTVSPSVTSQALFTSQSGDHRQKLGAER